MLTRILTYHQVVPEFLDFVSVFGHQEDRPREAKFSAFEQQCMLSNPPQLTPFQGIGRSGRQYQLCYNLRSVSIRDTRNQMNPQQAAFHHQFDIDTGTALWIIAKGDLGMEARLNTPDLVQRFGTVEGNFIASLEIHRRHCHWSTEGWPWYLQWLEDLLKTQESHTLT